MAAPDLMTRLRETTRPAHGQLEALPYFQALGRGELAIESYLGHLRAMAVLHGVLERSLAKAQDPRLPAAWTADLGRFARVQADLDFFAPRALLDIAPAMAAAYALVNQVLRRALDQPISLLGYLYVLEGSIGGAQVLAPQVAAAFGLDARGGLAYLSWDPAQADRRWREFGQRMNALALAPGEDDAIVAAASEAFAGFQPLFEALHPFRAEQLTRTAAALNPEAGDHPVPTDPAELEAVHRAGLRSWQECPYFAWRFGERGWRYTQSDGGWLATLAAQRQAVVDAQVAWLAGVLAARGMPSLLLQRHLELLYEELWGRVPARPGVQYGRLLAAADRLAERRRAVLDDAVLESVGEAFAQAVGADWRTRLPGTGALLACAVADRAHGVEQAVASIVGWLADPARFPPHWIAAVQQALRAAETGIRR